MLIPLIIFVFGYASYKLTLSLGIISWNDCTPTKTVQKNDKAIAFVISILMVVLLTYLYLVELKWFV